ncbi:hypothetical protein ACFYXH_41845 [Streptomyces sp. NPDC002730]|uniref:hypothetical protein n=1 Tax=Streptomyces sp. NPDC002730 TaxID=3364662 RepID=UPI0036CBA76A
MNTASRQPRHAAASRAPQPREKRFPRLRWAMKHPLRTLRRNHGKSIHHNGFGLAGIVVVGGFTAVVVGWVVAMLVSMDP